MQQVVRTPVRKPIGSSRLGWLRGRFSGRRGRNLREYLTGYLMILPASILIFVFGIFPVGFALYVSLYKWRLIRTDFLGLGNYTKAVANLTFIGLFALAAGCLVVVWILLRRIARSGDENEETPWPLAIPAVVHAGALISFLRWTVLLLPEVLDIAEKARRLERTRELFLQLFGEALRAETVVPAFQLFIILTLLAPVVAYLASRRWKNPRNLRYQLQFTLAWLAAAFGVFLLWFTYSEAVRAYQAAFESGVDPGIWPQVVTIGAGLVLLVISWIVWRTASNQTTNRAFWARVLASLVLLVAGWLLIGELPMVLASGDEKLWSGLKVTIFYSLGTVPFQLAISLFLAVLLFQRLTGSGFFRMLYFLPYVTPFVASAAVFRQLFSSRPQTPVNQTLQFFGFDPLNWLQEPRGIFSLLGESLGLDLPEWAAGPSLALFVVMLFTIWVYVGYDTVIYLAGLGNISKELIEAAQIDGAGRWQVFRNIIFPLLSPTTYFLSLIAVIGTFKAFNHIWVLRVRNDFALRTMDTFSVTIFLEFFDKKQLGYASALAFVLFAIILTLTYLNNKIQGSRVFYG